MVLFLITQEMAESYIHSLEIEAQALKQKIKTTEQRTDITETAKKEIIEIINIRLEEIRYKTEASYT